MENLDFVRGHGRHFDHLTMVILKFWSWSKIFDHMTMTPGPRPNGQKIMVALPPPPPVRIWDPSLKIPYCMQRRVLIASHDE